MIENELETTGLLPSIYNIYFSCGSKNYVFNTWHGNLINLEQLDFNGIKSGSLNSISAENLEKITKLGFLTRCGDEFSCVLKENLLHQTKSYIDNFSICILPTLRCNASCYYCFENGVDGCLDLDEPTQKNIIKYIEKEGKGKHVHIGWFGGEPLVGAKTISKICDALLDAGVSFSSGMISNGYFIDENIGVMRSKWHLKRAQITIDDLHEKYDRIKEMGANAFEKVVSNIHLLIDNGIKVSIRINYNSESLGNYQDIVEFIYKEFGNTVKLYFHDIIGPNFKTPDETIGKPLLKIYECLFSYGYIKSLKDLRITRKFSACSINKENFVNVYPGGWTNKCEHFVGKKSKFDSDNILTNDFNPCKTIDSVREKCRFCKCFPICAGGCYANHLMRDEYGCFRGNTYLEDILKFYVENVLEK